MVVGGIRLQTLRLEVLKGLQVTRVVLHEPVAQVLDFSVQISALAPLSILSGEVEACAHEHEGGMTNKTHGQTSDNRTVVDDGLPVAEASILEAHVRRIILFLHPQMTVLHHGIHEMAQAAPHRHSSDAVNCNIVGLGDGGEEGRSVRFVVKPIEWNAKVGLRDRRPNAFLSILDGLIHKHIMELLVGQPLLLLHLA